ncbi:GntR family transcriptional regulator [Gracilimonas mengyeensis]|uniref:Transcriptional regulator, GntR family n=1 Tax=Gracilimonas mengyeensis TaxID=1302730 RepID=A0A521F6J3_9BACT|nr:GntR family transcriptional regulator [Gracilimonas mengyeensis]SMO91802.1 transcriptional regulator, GntR family [Gracilimonas mengyeensis]
MEQQASKHEQVKQHLHKEITEGNYEPGEKLPSEKRLCDYFKVSRVTVRHALQNLENDGFIYRKQGVGAFVSNQNYKSNLVRLTDFAEDMRQAGLQSSSRLIELKKVDPIKEVNEILDIRPDMKLIQVDRVRLGSGKPIAFDTTWLPPGYGQLLFDEDLTTQTIYNIIEEKYEIPINAGSYRITAANANKFISKHLKLSEGDAVLEIDRCSRTTGNKKVYFQKRYYNPTHVSYVMELSRTDESQGPSKQGLPLKEFSPRFAK